MTIKNQLAGIIAAAIVLSFAACKKEDTATNPGTTSSSSLSDMIGEKNANPDEADLTADAVARHGHNDGYLYTESNATAHNEILCYKQHSDGSLSHESTVASGGTGIGIFQGLGLDVQGALALSANHEWLFAVNAGSNTISSFEVHNDGSIALAHTVSSGGTAPVSLCCYHHYLYVVNSVTSNICGYTVGAGGTLTAIPGSNLPLSSAASGPAQIAFSPNGEYLYITEKMTNKICSFDVDPAGLASFDQAFSSTGNTPFGFSIARDNFLVVSNANVSGGMAVSHGSSATSYSGVNPGTITAVNGAVANNQTAACWVATTKYGRFAYIANAGSDDISSYYVAPSGALYLVHASAVSTGAAPKDLCVAANNYYVYGLNTGAQTIGGYHRAFLGDLASIGTTSGLPEFATGLVAW